MKEGTQQKKRKERERENNRVLGDSWLVFLENLSFREAFSTFLFSPLLVLPSLRHFSSFYPAFFLDFFFFPGSLVSSSGWRGVRDSRRGAEGEDCDQSPAASSIGLREKKGGRARERECIRE